MSEFISINEDKEDEEESKTSLSLTSNHEEQLQPQEEPLETTSNQLDIIDSWISDHEHG